MFRRNINWRFHFFIVNNKNYCFDCNTHRIISINNKLQKIIENKNYDSLKSQYSEFYKTIFIKKKFQIIKKKEENCCVTINFSNTCNLNCSYCYRDKKDISKLTIEELEDILLYVHNIYMPDAKQYIFSLGFTSESSLNIEYLIAFDKLIGKYEGYLFSDKIFINLSPTVLLERIPDNITNKYNKILNPIEKLNQILINEELWKVYDFSNNQYLFYALNKTKKLSYSKKIMVNRQILNDTFPEFDLKEDIRYFSMSFMTNGTNVTDEYIMFLKSILMDEIYVSIDGPEYIHDLSRKYPNGKGSFSDTLNGIKKLQKSGINVIGSIVITPQNLELDKIALYLLENGITQISFNLARGNIECNKFSKKDIEIFINSIKKLYETIFVELNQENYTPILFLLKKTMIFEAIKFLYYRKYKTARCHWGQDIVIDSKGYLYHCNSTINNKKDCIGHYKDELTSDEINYTPFVDGNPRCKKCYVKYLCGGTCYAEIINGTKTNIDMECYFRKSLINEELIFYTKLYENNLLEKFILLSK
jgi:radical SAM protein with 4Fe4S-binding SPASM domain